MIIFLQTIILFNLSFIKINFKNNKNIRNNIRLIKSIHFLFHKEYFLFIFSNFHFKFMIIHHKNTIENINKKKCLNYFITMYSFNIFLFHRKINPCEIRKLSS